MNKSESTGFIIQTRITERERVEKAKALSKSEQLVNDIMDGQYSGASTDNSMNYDVKEINAYMSLD